jgi:adenosylhomocysteine nucleosidase
MQKHVIGIMGAMHEEIHEIAGLMTLQKTVTIGGRNYICGTINDQHVVIVFSRWGKVAAASTATILIREFGVEMLLFCGIAGALDEKLNIGDVVLGRRLYQYDMDARPLMRQFEIPLLNKTYFETDASFTAHLSQRLTLLFGPGGKIRSLLKKELDSYLIQAPRLIHGDIASGDRFISSSAAKSDILKLLPEISCVEMEGAAVAQICHENNIPFAIIRTISDKAAEHADMDFASFTKDIAGKYAGCITKALFLDTF